jgi:integrase
VPRIVRDARLESATQRERLPRERLHWCGISPGLALGYRRAKAGFGTWYVRILTERAQGLYSTRRLAPADDHAPADGINALSFWQARDKALANARAGAAGALEPLAPYTIEEAARDYMEWFRAHRKSAATTQNVIDAHILPKLRHRPLAELAKRDIEKWHQALASVAARLRTKKEMKDKTTGKMLRPAQRYRLQDFADPVIARRRRATANRLLSVLRAVLNFAWREGRVATDSAWRRVRPFHNASEPLVRYLEPGEATRLANACPADLRSLVRAALMTGCRYGELVALRVVDFRADAQSIHVRESKSGRPRHVPLSAEGLAFFSELAAGRAAAEVLFTRAGRPWGKNHQVRELAAACTRAKIAPAVSFHILRHTYASWLVQRGVALQVVAEVLGHSDTRITQKHYGHLAPSYVAQVIRENLPAIAPPARAKVRALRAPNLR